MKTLTNVLVLCIALVVPGSIMAATVTVNDPATSAGYEVDEYHSQTDQGIDLALIGIYEANSGHGFGNHPMYPASVVINNGDLQSHALDATSQSVSNKDICIDLLKRNHCTETTC